MSGLSPGSLDFAVLPGDNADDGTEAQFNLVRKAVAPLRLPLHILPGDHDFKPRNLDTFYGVLAAQRLPYAETISGYHRCLFLDVVSAGTGRSDFRLDAAHLDWIEQQISPAQQAVVFTHAYPADLRQGAERLCALLASPKVRCVDMGHTHYNELTNDGGTIYVTTRSTGQIEEGPPVFSIAALDDTSVSWRFQPLDSAWPCVLVTRPADRRLAVGSNETTGGALVVRAKVLGNVPIDGVEVKMGNGNWAPMKPVEAAIWQADCNETADDPRPGARRKRADGRACGRIADPRDAAAVSDGRWQRRGPHRSLAGEGHPQHPARTEPQREGLVNTIEIKASARSLRGLDCINVLMADVRDGVGPYLSIFLKGSQHWDPGAIGLAMGASSIAAAICQIPAGLLVDGTRAKRLLIAGSGLLVGLGCLLIVTTTRDSGR